MLLFDPPSSWKLAAQHRTWACAWLTAVALAILVCLLLWFVWPGLLGGSTAVGLPAGIAAGLLMLYLFGYALRKLPLFHLGFQWWPTKTLLKIHIWLGLFTLPLVALHALRITHWSWLTITLMTAYGCVMASGIWGLLLQQRVPTRLLEDIPDETIRAQIPELTEQLRHEAELLVLATCGPPAGNGAQVPAALRQHLGVVRATYRNKGTGLLAVLPPEPIPDSEPLRRYFIETVDPYLQPETGSRSRLFLRARIDADFKDLSGRLPAAAQPVVEALHDLCERRRQFDEQARRHDWLHAWVGFHLTLSAALVVLLAAHIFTAILYW